MIPDTIRANLVQSIVHDHYLLDASVSPKNDNLSPREKICESRQFIFGWNIEKCTLFGLFVVCAKLSTASYCALCLGASRSTTD